MYPWELEKFIKERENNLGGDDLLTVISTKINPQLNHIVYHPEINQYEMWDKEGNYYTFSAIPYVEAIQKGLVKKRRK